MQAPLDRNIYFHPIFRVVPPGVRREKSGANDACQTNARLVVWWYV
jgi:hypothetical protein